MSPGTDLASKLRQANRERHRQLDHHPLLACLVDKSLTTADYGQALAALHAPQNSLETLLRDFAPADLFPARTPALEADLAALHIAPYPGQSAEPQACCAAQRVGLMYVLEGANLGAIVIARCLDNSLPVSAPRHYFSQAGGQERWENFWRFVEPLRNDLAVDQIIAASQSCFDFYLAHLEGCRRNFLAAR